MIPAFPEFTPITIEHAEEIAAITRRFPPYSDFNFTSLFVWNLEDSTQVSRLGGNLVIRILDYIDNTPIYSILGDDATTSAVNQLLDTMQELRLVPEIVVNNISAKESVVITEDPDNFDYVYSIAELAKPSRNRRKKIKRVIADAAGNISVASYDRIDSDMKEALKEVFLEWAKEKHRMAADTQAELNALGRLLENSDSFNLVLSTFRVRGRLCGFSIDEPLDSTYAICHFAKSLNIHQYIYSFTDYAGAVNLQDMGIEKVNWEQDLGVAGLRTAKTNHGPAEILKKYTIRRK